MQWRSRILPSTTPLNCHFFCLDTGCIRGWGTFCIFFSLWLALNNHLHKKAFIMKIRINLLDVHIYIIHTCLSNLFTTLNTLLASGKCKNNTNEVAKHQYIFDIISSYHIIGDLHRFISYCRIPLDPCTFLDIFYLFCTISHTEYRQLQLAILFISKVIYQL